MVFIQSSTTFTPAKCYLFYHIHTVSSLFIHLDGQMGLFVHTDGHTLTTSFFVHLNGHTGLYAHPDQQTNRPSPPCLSIISLY